MLELTSQPADISIASAHLRREISSILRSFSWIWDGIITNPQDFEEVASKSAHQSFFMSWKAFETDLLSFHGDTHLQVNSDPHFHEMLRILGIGMEYPLTPSESLSLVSSPAPFLNVFDYQKLCSILAGYKFAELLALRENIGSRTFQNGPVGTMDLPPAQPSTRATLHAFDRLKDWPSIIGGFRTTVKRNISNSKKTSAVHGPGRLLTLLHLLVQNEKKTHYVNIENNFIHAALHVYAYIMGIFPRGAVPNLPGEHKNVQIHFPDDISQQDGSESPATLMKKHDGLSGGGTRHASLCAPLHLSLFISPIYLLFPFRIVKESFHRRDILDTSYKLGTNKPPILMAVENLIWEALFAIAERPADIEGIIAQLASNIPWDIIDDPSLANEEKSWFLIPKDPSITIHERNGIQPNATNTPTHTASSPTPRSSDGNHSTPTIPSLPLFQSLSDASFMQRDANGDDLTSSQPALLPNSSSSIETSAGIDGPPTPHHKPTMGAETDKLDDLRPCLTPEMPSMDIDVDLDGSNPGSLRPLAPPNDPIVNGDAADGGSTPASTPDRRESMEMDDDPGASNDMNTPDSFEAPGHPDSMQADIGADATNGTNATANFGIRNPSDSMEIDDTGDDSNGLGAPAAHQVLAGPDRGASFLTPTLSDKRSLAVDSQDSAKALAERFAISINMAHGTVDPSRITINNDGIENSFALDYYDVDLRYFDDLGTDYTTNLSNGRKRTFDSVQSDSERSKDGAEKGAKDGAEKGVEDGSSSEDSDDSTGRREASHYKTRSKSSKVLPRKPTYTSQTKPKKSQTPKPRKKKPSVSQKGQPAFGEQGETEDNPINIDAIYSIYEPITVKEYSEKNDISFVDEPAPKVESPSEYHAYDTDGNKVSFKLKAHFSAYVERVGRLFDHAASDYVEDMPRRFSDPETSVFKTITYDEFTAMDDQATQKLLALKNVLVTGCPYNKNLKFDLRGLRSVTGAMSQQVSITDFSIMAPLDDDEDQSCMPAVVNGYVKDLLKNAEETDTSKILNGLDFPIPWDASGDRSGFATDVAAWDVTRGLHIYDAATNYPTGDVCWGLAGLKHATTWKHEDPDGLSTFINVGMGAKAWGILRERPGLKTSSIDFFLHEGFELTEVDEKSQYDFEMVALKKGDRLYMRPNTVHFVYGMENSICYGGHFYSTLLMQRTLQGVVHSFMLDKFITNTSHPASRQLLRRILVFYLHGSMHKEIPIKDPAWIHLPDLETIDGLMNLLSVCVLAILGNALDFRTYTASSHQDELPLTESEELLLTKYDINGITTNERLAICFSRGVALHLFAWVRACCVVYGPDTSVVKDLPSKYLVQVGRAILFYKERIEQKGLEGVPNCSNALLTAQINNAMSSCNIIQKMWMAHSKLKPCSLELKHQSKYRVQWKPSWETDAQWASPAAPDYKNDGCTAFDLKYFRRKAYVAEEEAAKVLELLMRDKQPQKRQKRN